MLAGVPETGGEYHIELSRGDDGRDAMLLSIERHPDARDDNDEALAAHIAKLMQHKVFVSPKVHLVGPGSLPRSMGKSKRVTDKRF